MLPLQHMQQVIDKVSPKGQRCPNNLRQSSAPTTLRPCRSASETGGEPAHVEGRDGCVDIMMTRDDAGVWQAGSARRYRYPRVAHRKPALPAAANSLAILQSCKPGRPANSLSNSILICNAGVWNAARGITRSHRPDTARSLWCFHARVPSVFGGWASQAGCF
jgi:hypothetical protein